MVMKRRTSSGSPKGRTTAKAPKPAAKAAAKPVKAPAKAAAKPVKSVAIAAAKPAAPVAKAPVKAVAAKAPVVARPPAAVKPASSPSTVPTALGLLDQAERLREAIQRSKLTHPDPWSYTPKARGWGERAQTLVDQLARGEDGTARRALETLAAAVEGDRDFQEARRLF